MILYEIEKILNSHHAKLQYGGIWNIMHNFITDNKFTRVLEFGTREGYSTRIFAEALKITGGDIWTVDIEGHKMSAEEMKPYPNIHIIKSDVRKLEWKEPVDILYIDDLHEKTHLLWELETFASLAKFVMCHDVIQTLDEGGMLLEPCLQYCFNKKLPLTVFPMNVCGLSMIEMK